MPEPRDIFVSEQVRPPTVEESKNLRTLFEQTGLQYQQPLSQLYGLLTEERKTRVDGGNGVRDQRGEEQLFPSVFLHERKPIKGILPIVFIGNAHYPLLQKMAAERGFVTMITSSISSENIATKENHSDTETQNGYAGILEHSKYYHIEESSIPQGYPILVLGDTHGKEYQTRFPDASDLGKLGISQVVVYTEDVTIGLPPENALLAL